MKTRDITGAGIICYFDNSKGKIQNIEKDIVYLILIDNNNYYDFPKGTIDPGEETFECAVRETYEESNLEIIDFKNLSETKMIRKEGLVLFLGELNKNLMNKYESIIKIKPNPKLKIREHKSFKFVSKDTAYDKMLGYLKPFLKEADDYIRSHNE